MKILVTGGAGFIGSHTVVELLEENLEVVVFDNLSNSKKMSLDRVKEITGKEAIFVKGDLRSVTDLEKVFSDHKFKAVIHFAGLKAVGESCEKPLEYYENNITGTLNLLNAMRKYQVKSLIFSSSSTVYGDPQKLPLTEDHPTGAITNPYGRTKYMIEEICKDLYASDHSWNITLLRYFNPIGAHPSGLIGEDPQGLPNNLLPFVTQTAIGKREYLSIFGDDYDTVDGTGVRDYIHVVDLAKGHVKAFEHIDNSGLKIYNLGTGKGYSVLEIVRAFEKVNNLKVKYQIAPRRSGDIAANYADPALAYKELDFKTQYGIEEMCRDSWNWQKNNPNGFEE